MVARSGTDFTKVTLDQIKLAQHPLNNRSKKVLDCNKPLQEFKKQVSPLET